MSGVGLSGLRGSAEAYSGEGRASTFARASKGI